MNAQATGMQAELEELEKGIRALKEQLPRRAAEIFRRSSYRVSAYIARFMNRTGPPRGVISTSPHITIRTGATYRATIPGDEKNINEFTVGDVKTLWNYGYHLNMFRAAYPLLQEYGNEVFNVHFRARPSFGPGMDEFVKMEGPVIDRAGADAVEDIWRSA